MRIDGVSLHAGPPLVRGRTSEVVRGRRWQGCNPRCGFGGAHPEAFGILLLLAAGACAPAAPRSAAEATAVIIVRHAETRSGEGSDPALSTQGIERAEALREALARSSVEAVYTTQYRRTRETGAVVAAACGIDASVLPIDGGNAATYAEDLAARIRSVHAGGTVLVVGHSNTVPDLVAALGGGSIGSIPESEYDRLYLLLIDGSGRVRRIAGEYGTTTD